MSVVNVVYKGINEIHPYDRNPRRNENAVDKVAASIQMFGFLVPIVIDKDDVIVAGHTRFLAAQKLGLKEIPTITADDLDETQVQAYRIVDNRVAEMAVWDLPLLSEAMDDIGDTIDMAQFGFEFDPDDMYEQAGTIKQFDEDEFGDEAFEYECPACGFRFDG